MTQGKRNLDNFVCRRCGFCCSISGYVFLKAGEAEQIAEFLGMDIYEFTDKYTVFVNGHNELSLTEQSNGRCIFLEDDNTCRIQSVKPLQCIGFPHLWSDEDLEKGCAGFKAMNGMWNV